MDIKLFILTVVFVHWILNFVDLPTTETTIIGTQRMKVISQYLFRIYIYWGSVIITSNVVSSNVAKYLSYLSCYCH